jgi:hypothetical protein
MPGIWSRKFDYKNGETRVCKLCGESFYTVKPRYRCNACINAKQKIIETVKRAKYEKKEQYPFDNKGTESANRFCRIRTAMNKAWREFEKTGDKSIVIAHYDKQLKEIHDNGIWKWIWDRRDGKTITGRTIKSKEQITNDFPDTRGHYEE